MKIGYIRVSTKKQKSERQIRGMEELCNRLYVEKASAASENRPIFEKVLSILKKGRHASGVGHGSRLPLDRRCHRRSP